MWPARLYKFGERPIPEVPVAFRIPTWNTVDSSQWFLRPFQPRIQRHQPRQCEGDFEESHSQPGHNVHVAPVLNQPAAFAELENNVLPCELFGMYHGPQRE